MKINEPGELLTKVIKCKSTGDVLIPVLIEYAEYIFKHIDDYEIVTKFETEKIEVEEYENCEIM